MNSETDPNEECTFRSPLLMNRHDTAVVIVDVQEKLLPHISRHEEMLWNIGRIVDGACVLGLPVHVTEQYPKGLGMTDSNILSRLDPLSVHEKSMFSCRECTAMLDQLSKFKIAKILLVGIETHVCVMQSAMDMLAHGFDVYVCVDAVGSRFEEDEMTAMQRMETTGVTLVSTEMALFEWCERAGSDEFKEISQIVKEPFVSN